MLSRRRRLAAILAGVATLAIAAVLVIIAATGGGETAPAGQEADAGSDRAAPEGKAEQRADGEHGNPGDDARSRSSKPDDPSSDRSPGRKPDEKEGSAVREAIERAAAKPRSEGSPSAEELFGGEGGGLDAGEAERLLEELGEDERE